jgi:hypothetical protein
MLGVAFFSVSLIYLKVFNQTRKKHEKKVE